MQNTEYRLKNTEYRIQIKEYIIQNTEYRIRWTWVNLNSNRTDTLYQPGLSDARQDTAPTLLCRPGFNFDGAIRLFTWYPA